MFSKTFPLPIQGDVEGEQSVPFIDYSKAIGVLAKSALLALLMMLKAFRRFCNGDINHAVEILECPKAGIS